MTSSGSNPVINQATEKLSDIEQKVQELFNNVNEVLSWVPGFLSHLIDPIERGLNELNQKMTEFWNKVSEFVTQHGDPERLKQVGTQWVDEIGNVIGDIAGTIALHKLKTSIEWEGSAAETYKATIPAQVDGLNAMEDLGTQMRDSLNDLANGIDSFWNQVYAILIGLGVALVTAIASACTVVGIPAAIVILVGAIGASIAAIFTAISAVDSLMNTITSQQNAITDKVENLGTKWANTDTSTMNDLSEWDIR